MYDVTFYSDSKGDEPIVEFISELRQKSYTNKTPQREIKQAKRNLVLHFIDGFTKNAVDFFVWRGKNRRKISDFSRVFNEVGGKRRSKICGVI